MAGGSRRLPQDQRPPRTLTLRVGRIFYQFFLSKGDVLCWADLDKLLKMSA